MKLMRLLFYPCKKASELIDRRSIEPLTATEKARLTMHLSMCKKCSGYAKHSEFVDTALERLFEENMKDDKKQLDEESKKELIKRLQEEFKK